MLRWIYRTLGPALLPALLCRIWWRGRKEPGYRRRWRERLGQYAEPAPDGAPFVWIHAVSLGETRAALPLVAALLRAYPQARILLTHLTATGREAGARWNSDRVTQAWLPWDYPAAVTRFLAHFRPVAGILMETEVWPELLAQAQRRGVPMFLVNARLSERSAQGYQRAGAFARNAFASFTGVAAQTEADARRLAALGATMPAVTGNLKFDCAPPDAEATRGGQLRALWGKQRMIWVAGSTREGEEALILDALAMQSWPQNLLLVFVPRHPQRFEEVAALLARRGLRFARRSAGEALAQDVQVLLGDSMGEMLAYYTAADLVFVGGSLLPFGAQNLIEACACGKPVLLGPSIFNFAEAAASAITAGAAIQVAEAASLVATMRELAVDPARRERMGAAGLAFAAAHRGATERLLAWLKPALDSRISPPRDSG